MRRNRGDASLTRPVSHPGAPGGYRVTGAAARSGRPPPAGHCRVLAACAYAWAASAVATFAEASGPTMVTAPTKSLAR